MKPLLISFTAIALSVGITPAALADNGFGEKFTGQSYKAFNNPDTDKTSMDEEAARIQAIEPAAGDVYDEKDVTLPNNNTGDTNDHENHKTDTSRKHTIRDENGDLHETPATPDRIPE